MAPTSDPDLYRKTALYGAYVTFMVGRSSMFLLFLGILHFTSKDTKYDYPRFIKWCYLILAVLVPMMLIGWSTYDRWISYDEDLFQVRRYLDHANTVTLCLFSTVLFCRVLVRVSWNQLRQDRTSPMNACHDKDTEERVKKLLDLITKYTILTLAVVIFAVIVIVMDEMTWNGMTFGFAMDDWLSMLFILYYIDCFVNVFCVYLRFAFSNWMYNRLCLRAHQGLICWVTGCIRYRLDRSVSNTELGSNEGEQFTLTIELSTKEHKIKIVSSGEGSPGTPTNPVTPPTPMTPCSPIDSIGFDFV